MRSILIFSLLIAALLLVSLPPAQAAPPAFELVWWTVDGGGATFTSAGSYSLGGTIGQPDTGTATGGTYTLNSGFWGGGVSETPTPSMIYLPLLIR